MSNHLLVASASGRTMLQKVREPASATSAVSGEFAYDAPALKSATVIVSDPAPASAVFERTTKTAPPSHPRSILIFVGALFISIALIASAVIATALYL